MRQAFILAIRDRIDHKRGFKADDFEIQSKRLNNAHTFSVVYRYATGFRVNATIGSGGSVKGTIAPGELAESETFEVEGQYSFLKRLDDWMSAIAEEMRATPLDEGARR